MTDNLKGRLTGGILLVAGSCIGAAMLGLPVLTAQAGFIPAEVCFLIGWLFMAATGLLLLEVNLWLGPGASIISMVQATLGSAGRYVAWSVYLFLFYTLLVALISGSGALVHHGLRKTFDIDAPRQVADILFVFSFGLFVYYGTRVVDQANRLLMIGLFSCYVLLLVTGLSKIEPERLTHIDWSKTPFLLPVTILSFGYHNLIPSLTSYLKGNLPKLRTSVLLGSFIPFIVYILWQTIVLGSVPLEGPDGLQEALVRELPANLVLHQALGVTHVAVLADGFALFAILTTLIGVALSFVDFLADGLGTRKDGGPRLLLCIVVLLPPLLISLIDPHQFLTALNIAGGFGAVVLFGVLPPLMVYNGRYRKQLPGPRLLPGGRPVLLLILLMSVAIFLIELVQELGLAS